MTLNTNEIVYTADLMNISPANDAQIYGKGGNYILSGLEIRAVTSTSATLTAGRALIQGRLFELKANTQYTLTAGTSQYLGLEIDLTKENIDDGMGNITNNQFTVKSNDGEYGDTRLGDVQSFVAFYQVNTQTQTSTQLVQPYYDFRLLDGYGDVGFPDFNSIETPRLIKQGKVVSIYGAVKNASYVANNGSWLTVRVLPQMYRPYQNINKAIIFNGKLSEMRIASTGELQFVNRTGAGVNGGGFIPLAFTFVQQ